AGRGPTIVRRSTPSREDRETPAKQTGGEHRPRPTREDASSFLALGRARHAPARETFGPQAIRRALAASSRQRSLPALDRKAREKDPHPVEDASRSKKGRRGLRKKEDTLAARATFSSRPRWQAPGAAPPPLRSGERGKARQLRCREAPIRPSASAD